MTVLTTGRHLSLSYATKFQYAPSNPIALVHYFWANKAAISTGKLYHIIKTLKQR
jgi:hypothetical protein